MDDDEVQLLPVDDVSDDAHMQQRGGEVGCEDDEPSPHNNAFEEATAQLDHHLQNIGIGRFHWLMLTLCGWANASDAVELMAVSFVITSTAECTFTLTEARKGWVTSSMFAGMMLGSWLWGSLAHHYGRRPALLAALVLNGLCGIISGLVSSYGAFIFFRIMSGFGVGGSIPVVFSYFLEFLPRKNRGRYISLLAAFWMLGTILVAGLAWGIIGPTECPRDSNDKRSVEQRCADMVDCGNVPLASGQTESWRVFLIVSSLPALISGICLIWAPESPRWLISVARYEEASNVVRKMAKANLGKRGASISVDIALSSGDTQMQDMGAIITAQPSGTAVGLPPTQRSFLEIARESTVTCYEDTKTLFRAPLKRNMLTLAGIWSFLSFGFYGMTIWLPEYFKNGGIDDDTNIYEVSFFVGLANLPGNIYATLIVDKIGRKWTLASSLFMSGMAVFLIFAVHTTAGTTAFACAFAAVSVAAWNALDVLSAELFPTEHRTTAFGLLASFGRICAILGNTVFGQFSGDNSAIPLLLMGASLGAGGALCFFLPETKNSHLH